MARNRRTKRIQSANKPENKKDSTQAEPGSVSARQQRRERAREQSRLKGQERLLLLGTLAITALAYMNALNGEFVYDDRLQVLNNPTLSSLGNIPKMFTQGV